MPPAPPDPLGLEARWRELAEKVIGRGLEDLRAGFPIDVEIAPLYPRRKADGVRPWRQNETWSVAQRIDHPDPHVANSLALLDLDGGADALTLVTAGSPYARGFGLAPSFGDLETALAGVELDFVSLRLDAGGACRAVAEALTRIIEDRRLTSARLIVDLGFDPIGTEARTGQARDSEDGRAIVSLAQSMGLAGRPFLADGRPYLEAGAGAVQELAAVLATGVAYLRELEAIVPLPEARDLVAVMLAADADIVVGLAKMRAIRRLWARIETAIGVDPKPLRLHVETSWRMMTRYDPWTNALRATAATVAAGVGGADAVTVLPMTLPLGLPDAAARRLARNLQRVLIDESNLAKVADPAAGSGAFEALTTELCETAWAQFQDIERAGGIVAALRTGTLRADIAETAAAHARSVAVRAAGIVGTSLFPSLAPSDLKVLAAAPGPAPQAGILPTLRDAEPFEALREEAETKAAAGRRPTVFLATLGPPAAVGQRAGAAANFFAAAGIAVTRATVASGIDALVAEFLASSLAVACLCGPDASYAADGAAAAAALRDAGARYLIVIGRPDGIAAAGIDAFVHDGCDAPKILAKALAMAAEPAIAA